MRETGACAAPALRERRLHRSVSADSLGAQGTRATHGAGQPQHSAPEGMRLPFPSPAQALGSAGVQGLSPARPLHAL